MERLDAWMREYGRAWEERSSEVAISLFAEDVAYHETPFAEPMRGRDAIASYWTEVTETQRDVRFSWEVLSDEADLGVARWTAEFTRVGTGAGVRLDGVAVLRFDGEERCREFREWWHLEEGPPAA